MDPIITKALVNQQSAATLGVNVAKVGEMAARITKKETAQKKYLKNRLLNSIVYVWGKYCTLCTCTLTMHNRSVLLHESVGCVPGRGFSGCPWTALGMHQQTLCTPQATSRPGLPKQSGSLFDSAHT